MKNIDGQLLKQMIISGTNNLYNHYPEVDSLNVFPVPDGDTGMNMNLTMSSGMKEIQNRNDSEVYPIAVAFSKGLLMGARGNSGVITSQIFRGFAQSLEGKKVMNAVDLAEAFVNGSEVAYKAVIRPVEGTILTVIRESSKAMLAHVNSDFAIEKAFAFLLNEAKASLQRTPELLPILKEVGVVDSGGFGLVTIFEGMERALLGDVVEKSQATVFEERMPQPEFKGERSEDEFGYCTEFILRLGPDAEKKPFVEKRFTGVLNSHGNSLVVVKDDDIVKVHIHTLEPGSILNYAQNFGEFVTLKIENMTEQHSHLDIVPGEEAKLAVEEKPLKDYALIAVSAGDGLNQIFSDIGVDYIVSGGQTMNPATEDFLTAIEKVHARNVYILPNNSNIVMTASQACDVIEGETIARVVPSKTIPQGIVAAMMFNPDLDPEENFKEMKAALKNVVSGSVTYAIKDTDIEGIHVTKGYYMGFRNKSIIVCVKDKIEALHELLKAMIDENAAILTVILGEDVTESEESKLSESLFEAYPELEIDIKRGQQPVYSFLIGVE
ncbi:MAG TPA: DAK2 domain-containing protein [Bacilli bacterium]|nr:DAK2 domain-containing protein [Bacilli bacterium]HPV70051.1 DAK2 domain-containing protein [Bacilli bacterium]HQC32793.1 DAK2 domain-containing protein [Bacilli bacterium]